jgi:hypothetical protein
MDEEQISEYLWNMGSALLNLSMMIRQYGSEELKSKALPLLEGRKFGHGQVGIFDVLDALKEEFPESEEEEGDEDEEDEDLETEDIAD